MPFIFFLFSFSVAAAATRVTAARLSQHAVVTSSPLCSHVYNPAWVPQHDFDTGRTPGDDAKGGPYLLVRCQNVSVEGSPFASALAISRAIGFDANGTAARFSAPVGPLLLAPSASNGSAAGVEDPRAVRTDDGQLLIFYSAVSKAAKGASVPCRLSLASVPLASVTDPSAWTLHGPLFADSLWPHVFQFSKSGAAVARATASGEYTMLFGDSSIVPGLQVATSRDLVSWRIANFSRIVLPTRPGFFDSALVEAGPPPVQLPDGTFLFVYNGAATVHSSVSETNLVYCVGWAILDQDDPSIILQRSDEPILCPQLPWERQGLTPNVVFAEALAPGPTATTFTLYYGAADTTIGAATISVHQ